MSGTVGKKYFQKIEQQKKAMLARQRVSALQKNREEAIALVLTAFGWTKLEPWAEQKLNVLFNGGTIDLKEFAELLQEWKKEQLEPKEPVTEEVTEEPVESTENGDNEVQ